MIFLSRFSIYRIIWVSLVEGAKRRGFKNVGLLLSFFFHFSYLSLLPLQVQAEKIGNAESDTTATTIFPDPYRIDRGEEGEQESRVALTQWLTWTLGGIFMVSILLWMVAWAFRAQLREKTKELSDQNDRLRKEINERHELENQLHQVQKMEAMGRFAGGIAHDFNNVLLVILATCDLMRDSLEKGEPIEEDVDGIEEAAKQAKAMTSQLLAFSRKQKISATPLKLDQIVKESIPTLKRLLGGNIVFDVKYQSDCTIIKVDQGQLEQILLNLIANARDAMGGKGEIILRTFKTELTKPFRLDGFNASPGQYVGLEVCDSGQGIEEEARPHIFEPFYTSKGLDYGTGLGLATVYSVVSRNKGFIEVISKKGEGATFRVCLPEYAEA